MQFFVFYVLSPFLFGFTLLYTLAFSSAWTPWICVGWLFVQLIWPIGKYRRRTLDRLLEDLKEESEREGEIPPGKSVALAIGPTLITILAMWVGVQSVSLLLEDIVGMDLEAMIEEGENDG